MSDDPPTAAELAKSEPGEAVAMPTTGAEFGVESGAAELELDDSDKGSDTKAQAPVIVVVDQDETSKAEPDAEPALSHTTTKVRQVILEDFDEDDGPEEPLPVSEPDNEEDQDEDAEDDFGDFDDNDDFNDFDEFAAQDPQQLTQPETAPPPSQNIAPAVITLADIGPGIAERASKLLPRPGLEPVKPSQDHLTPTSKLLWSQLMDTPNASPVDWQSSALHRRLAISLGVPLNLDQTLPKVETRKIRLPSSRQESVDGGDLPRWHLLALVSKEALDSMSVSELQAHLSQLREAIDGATKLKEELEAEEMDLEGEKHVLEGMVDSFLAYAQKSDRAKLVKAKAKAKSRR